MHYRTYSQEKRRSRNLSTSSARSTPDHRRWVADHAGVQLPWISYQNPTSSPANPRNPEPAPCRRRKQSVGCLTSSSTELPRLPNSLRRGRPAVSERERELSHGKFPRCLGCCGSWGAVCSGRRRHVKELGLRNVSDRGRTCRDLGCNAIPTTVWRGAVGLGLFERQGLCQVSAGEGPAVQWVVAAGRRQTRRHRPPFRDCVADLRGLRACSRRERLSSPGSSVVLISGDSTVRAGQPRARWPGCGSCVGVGRR